MISFVGKVSNRIVFFLTIFCLLSSGVATAKATEANNPVALLDSIATQMISNLQKNKMTLQANRQYVYSLAYRLVVPHVDIDEMSHRVLPPQTWQKANAGQRAAFQHQFIQLLVHTYASALAAYTDQTVQFFPVRGAYQDKATVEVNSQITSANGAPPVKVKYRLIQNNKKGKAWKLYDMSVEGVSVIESFRSQFADVLEQGDIDALTRRLAQHNTQVPPQ